MPQIFIKLKFKIIRMIFIINVITGLFFSTTSTAQKCKTLFEIGDSLDNPESNFKNLFKNFPLYVENTNEISFLNYKFIKKIRNTKETIHYLKKNFKNDPPLGFIQIEGGTDSYEKKIILISDSNEIPNKKNIIKNIAKNYIQKGFKLYAVIYLYQKLQHTFYFFINPEDNTIVTKGNSFALCFYPGQKVYASTLQNK